MFYIFVFLFYLNNVDYKYVTTVILYRRMGANGIVMIGPEENGGIVVPNPQGGVDAVIDAGEDDIEDYDENVVKSLLDIFDK